MTTPKEKQPKWFKLGNQLMWPLVGMGLAVARSHRFSSPDLEVLGELALLHHAGCLQAGIQANRSGKHSVAISLVRQSVEALTITEIGLQAPEFAEPLLLAWKDGKKSHGELRRALEHNIWPNYGNGLWEETWSEFYGNLARAVQPYAHYSSELQGWQFVTLDYDGGKEFTAAYGLQTYDALQATRVTLFHMLLTYMLGRILLVHGKNADVLSRRPDIVELGQALASSKLLFNAGEWWAQLAPHMLFNSDRNWRDDS